ncbi:MAG: glycosyltransferase [Planctomycetota bacterium]
MPAVDVLHVIHQFPPETRGGSESYVHDVALRQRARGRDVEVLAGSLEPWGDVGMALQDVDGIPVHRLHRNDLYFDHHVKTWHPGVTRAFEQLLDQHRPKLVHVHHWVRLSCDLVEAAAARGVPCVVTIHDFFTSCPRAFRARADDPACMRPVGGASCWDCVPKYGHESQAELEFGVELYAASYRRELSQARAVLVAVGSVADLLAQTTGMPRDRYRVLPFGYRPRFGGAPPLPAPAAGEPFRFAFWGGVGRHKGVLQLLAAFRRLVEGGGPPSELHVLGGAESPAFEQELQAAAQGLPATLHGAFEHAQVRALMPHCGVFPSTCIETYGIVLDECFELGLPCIVSDLGPLPERAGAAGLVARAGDVAALADAMRRLATEPGLWQSLRQHVPPPPPTLDAHVDALQDAYAAAIAAPPPAPCAPAVPLDRRLHFLQVQRDSALTRLCPPGGPR